ncbi:restriction endonuclease subunit S, partial [Turicibacter sanguinis]|uniref:restriction endonuclease subunit S n=1 Tax=Turicibacter sanguinis TaxID=154288 RepID=UPI0018AAC20D
MNKEGYKKTSIGYIPLEWEVKKFKDITDILRCGLASTPEYVEGGIPFLSAQNVKNGKLNLDKYKCISNELHEKLTKNTKPQRNDILMTRVGNVGDAALVDIDWEFSVYVSLTHIRMKEGYDSNFFTQLLNSSFIKRRSLQTQYKGGGVANLNVKVVEEFDMPVPPLKEQQKIAEILSSVDAAIEKTEQVIAKTEEIKKGLMQQLLTKGIDHKEFKDSKIGKIPTTWEVKKFKDITDILRCGLASTPEYVENGIPFLSAQNVKNGKLNLDKYKCISNELHEKLTKNTKPQRNDILMTRVGNVGDAALVDIDWEFSVYVSLTHIRMKEGYDSNFFTQLLNSSFIKRRSLQTQYKGGGVANLNVKVA